VRATLRGRDGPDPGEADQRLPLRILPHLCCTRICGIQYNAQLYLDKYVRQKEHMAITNLQ
jgi:hypothetical protein